MGEVIALIDRTQDRLKCALCLRLSALMLVTARLRNLNHFRLKESAFRLMICRCTADSVSFLVQALKDREQQSLVDRLETVADVLDVLQHKYSEEYRSEFVTVMTFHCYRSPCLVLYTGTTGSHHWP